MLFNEVTYEKLKTPLKVNRVTLKVSFYVLSTDNQISNQVS